MKKLAICIVLCLSLGLLPGCGLMKDLLELTGLYKGDSDEGDDFQSPYKTPEVVCAYFNYFRTDNYAQWHYPGREPKDIKGPEAWRRDIWVGRAGDYPYLGTYDNMSNRDIIRWHIRLAKAAGITAFMIYTFDWANQQPETQIMFDVAAEENFKIGLCEHHSNLGAVPRSILDGTPQPQIMQKYWGYDQVMAMYADKIGVPLPEGYDVSTRPSYGTSRAVPLDAVRNAVNRITGMMNRWKSHPAYYRVDGKPFLMIPYGDSELEPGDFRQIAVGVEAQLRDDLYIVAMVPQVYWYYYPAHVPYSGLNQDWANCGADAFTHWTPNGMITADQSLRIKVTKFNVKDSVKWKKDPMIPLMPGFEDDAWRPGDVPAPTALRRDGEAWREQLQAAVGAKPRFLFIQAWNEWHEGSQIEPSTAYSDPYLYLKHLARSLGKSWQTPPLPPKGSIDSLRVKYLPY